MKMSQLAKNIAATFGIHLARNYQNPERTFLGLLSTQYKSIIDVGANIGQFARIMRRRFPEATLYCFEPTPQAFADLSRWASTQENIFPIPLALGDQSGDFEMHFHTQFSPSSSILQTTAHCEALFPFTAPQSKIKVVVERLDDYVANHCTSLAPELLLKLDVQGFETPVLRGGRKTLSLTHTCIVEINLDGLYLGQSRFFEIVELMESAGLSYMGNLNQLYAKDGHAISADAVFIRREIQPPSFSSKHMEFDPC